MHILYMVSYVPSLVRVRPYNLIRHLTRRGHQVTVFTLWTDERERLEAERLREECHSVVALPMNRWRSLWNCVLALPGSGPLQAAYSWNPTLAYQIRQQLKGNGSDRYDVVHIEHLRGARYAKSIQSHFPGMPLVWDSVDCISHLFAQASGRSRSLSSKIITQLELGKTRRMERRLVSQFDRTLVTSPVDRQAFLDLAGDPDAPVTVLPNGVDLEYFNPGESSERDPASKAGVVFSGKMSYHANVTMALYLVNEIMPLVWKAHPEVRLTIVGKDPPASIRALGENPNITVTGTVEDIRPYLRRASVAAVPMVYGAGLQNKVLEAMACGTPVVATREALSALQVQGDCNVLIAQDAGAFAENILELIRVPAKQQQIGEAGRQYVLSHHRWINIAAQLEGIYHEVIRTKRGIPDQRKGILPG